MMRGRPGLARSVACASAKERPDQHACAEQEPGHRDAVPRIDVDRCQPPRQRTRGKNEQPPVRARELLEVTLSRMCINRSCDGFK